MASDQQVSARAVLDAVMAERRQGSQQMLESLEQIEPDLTDFLLESLCDIHQQIHQLGGPAKRSRRLFRSVQSLTLVCFESLRRGHYELWRASDVGQSFHARPALTAIPSAAR